VNNYVDPPPFKRQIRTGGAWQAEWLQGRRAEPVQNALAQFFEALHPDLIAHLFLPFDSSAGIFFRAAEKWRIKTGCSYPLGHCPPRNLRCIEFALVLETGSHPRRTLGGRLHGHALVWNPGELGIDRIAACWRTIARIDARVTDEPRVLPFERGKGGAAYCFKEYGTSYDEILISDGLARLVAARGQGKVNGDEFESAEIFE